MSENGEYYFGGPTDFSGSDSLISKNVGTYNTIRTKQYNSLWLNEPQFVGSFETDKFVYFLFREAAVEYINCGKVCRFPIIMTKLLNNKYYELFSDNLLENSKSL